MKNIEKEILFEKKYEKICKKMELEEKLRIFDESFRTLRSKGVIKNYTDFARMLGASNNTISAAKHGNEKFLTDNLVSKIQDLMREQRNNISINHSPYSNVATGQSHITIESEKTTNVDNPEIEMIPVIPQSLYKETDINILDYVTDADSDVQMSPAVQQFPTTTCYYQVVTSAMFPHFHQGDILALKAISKNAPIVNGEVYAVDTNELGILVRFAYDRGDSIEMKSTPERSDRFESFKIPKSDIYTIFRIVGLIRTNI